MTSTAILSMWLSNTATTAMMVPIVHSVLMKLEENKNSGRVENIEMEEKYVILR